MIDRIAAAALAAGLSGSLLVNAAQAQTAAEFYKGSVSAFTSAPGWEAASIPMHAFSHRTSGATSRARRAS